MFDKKAKIMEKIIENFSDDWLKKYEIIKKKTHVNRSLKMVEIMVFCMRYVVKNDVEKVNKSIDNSSEVIRDFNIENFSFNSKKNILEII